MTATEINNLINVGATDRVRKKLKRMGISNRLRTLSSCIPHVKETTESLRFFKNNFSVEIGAILSANDDLIKAEKLYRIATSMK